MNPVIYKGCTITRSASYTTVQRSNGRLRGWEARRPLFAIEGSVTKAAGMRPFLTSLAEAKEFITQELEFRA